MRGWLIYKEHDRIRNEAFIRLLQQASAKRGMTLEVVIYEEMIYAVSGGASLFGRRENPDFLIIRTCTPWLNEAAELHGIRVFNSSRVSRTANDKRLSHACLSALGIPMLPSTAVHQRRLSSLSPSYPLILKDPLGRGGTGVDWVARPQQLGAMTADDELLMQPVGGQRGRDVRVYIVGGAIVAAVVRESETNFKANISGGASASLYRLSQEDTELIEKVTRALPIDFAGIDFLIADDGSLLFNEMEDAVGCRSLYDQSDIDIADVFIEHVAAQLK
ncbi:RimK family alpha-L-glutamate ligase [Bacillus daqingensis]|uniref:RimK family alpha-L-glutamate ligase n=1 Tax=Bacillus daqingensis TaxID=872396 RepID=A0ABV9NZB5_9BACI